VGSPAEWGVELLPSVELSQLSSLNSGRRGQREVVARCV